MFMSLDSIKKALRGATDRGTGFFQVNEREIHAMWINNRWKFIGYYGGYAVKSFTCLEEARQFLGL